MDILGLGAVAVDELIYVDAYPRADVKTTASRVERQCGGLAATALATAARLGSRCGYAGTLGTDELSDFALDRLREEGIDIAHVRRLEEVRPVRSVIIVGEQGRTRNVFSYSKEFSGPGEDWPPEEVIRSVKVLLTDHFGLAGMIRAARIAKEAGAAVVADAERDSGPRLAELLQLADHLILSMHFAESWTNSRTPAEAGAKLWHDQRQAVVITAGADGCWFVDGKNREARHVAAFQVQAVDTTGCGDVFHGAYAHGLVQGLSALERIRFASAAAALKATAHGGQAGIPRTNAVEKFLREQVGL